MLIVPYNSAYSTTGMQVYVEMNFKYIVTVFVAIKSAAFLNPFPANVENMVSS